MKTAVCLLVKNEIRDIAEWVLHHLSVGFSCVVVYDNGSDDGTAGVLDRLAGLYPVVRVPWPNVAGVNSQIAAYAHCITQCRGHFEWIAFIDADEYFVGLAENSIADMLARHAGQSHIVLNWVVFGSSGRRDLGDGLILESFLRRAPLWFGPNQHVKSIVRPERVSQCVNAHSFVTDRAPVNVFGQPVLAWQLDGITMHDGIVQGPWRLHHYFTRSQAHWDRRAARGGDPAVFEPRSRDDFAAYDRNEELDLAALKYVPALRASLDGLGPGFRRAG